MNVFDNIEHLTKTHGATHLAKMLLKEIKRANSLEISQIIYKMIILDKTYSHLYRLNMDEFEQIWDKIWQYYLKFKSGGNIIEQLLEQVNLNASQASNVFKNLIDNYSNSKQIINWAILIMEKYKLSFHQPDPCPEIIQLYCAQFSSDINLKLTSLEKYLCYEFDFWKKIWWAIFNQCWELNSDITYNYLSNNFQQIQHYIPEIKYAKELISGFNDDWNQLLEFNQPCLASLWIQKVPQVDDIPAEFYNYLPDNWETFVNRVTPNIEMIYNLINLEIELPELKDYIKQQINRKKQLPDALIFCLMTHDMSDLIKPHQFKKQINLAKYLVNRQTWDDNLLDSLYLFTEEKARYVLLDYFQNHQFSARAIKAMGVKDVYYQLAMLSYNSNNFQNYTRKYFLRIKQGNKRRAIEKKVQPELNYPMEPFDFNIKNVGFHKFLLVRFSDYFCEIFKESFKQNYLDIPFSREQVQRLHAFIYHHKIDSYTFEDFRLADYLGCRYWKHLILEGIINYLNTKNLADAIKIFDRTNNKKLKDKIIELMSTDKIEQIDQKLAQHILCQLNC